jgi:hypothetical protein
MQATKNRFRSYQHRLRHAPGARALAGAGLIGLASSALAQTGGGNDEALRAFAAQAGTQAPQLTRGADGETKLEWRGGISLDAYRNDITPPPGSGQVATPLNTGSFARLVFNTDIRLVEPGNITNFMQGTLTATNDRAVLSRYPNQIGTLQLGRTTQQYVATAGDLTANYSGLSSSLGLRGLSLTQKLGALTLSGHAGVVSESWEALMNRKPLDGGPARNQFIRNVHGVKGEYAVFPALKIYTTFQGFNDRETSLPIERITIPAAQTRSWTSGFIYQEGNGSLAAELAESRFRRDGQSLQNGRGWVVDGTYRLGAVTLRGGWHDITPEFVSLAQSVPPGIEEGYAGADWTAASWLTLGGDYRDSKTRFAAPFMPMTPNDPFSAFPPPLTPAPTQARGFNSRANINFGSNWPGWNLSLQDAQTENIDSQGNKGRGRNSTASLSFSIKSWNGSATFGTGFNKNLAFPQSDSRMENAQLQVGRNWTLTDVAGAPTWSFILSTMAGQQVQTLTATGTETRGTSFGLNFGAQHQRYGQLNAQWSDAVMTQPNGGPDLTTRTFQLDLTYPITPQHSVKGYLRNVRRNMGDANLETSERLAGMQFNLTW